MNIKELILKYSLISIELLSTCSTVLIFIFLFYFMVKLRFTDFSSSNQMLLQIDYMINEVNNSKYSIKINPVSYKIVNEKSTLETNSSLGIIIINKEFYLKFSNMSEYMQNFELEECFFMGKESLGPVKNLMSILNNSTSDFFDISVGLTLLLFCFSMKVYLVFETKATIDSLSINWNKYHFSPFFTITFFYNYFISFFYFMNLKPIYSTYFDYKYDTCFGFNEFAFDNYYYDRKFIGHIDSPNILVRNDPNNRYAFIINSKNDLFEIKEFSTGLIIIYLCLIVFISKYFIVLDNNKKISFRIYPENDQLSQKIISLVKISFMIFSWLAFFLYGALYYIDLFTFYIYLIAKRISFRYCIVLMMLILLILLYLIILFISIINKILQVNDKVNLLRLEEFKISQGADDCLDLKREISLKTSTISIVY